MFGFEISWDERKRLALDHLNSNGIRYENDIDYIHWLAYHQYSERISKEISYIYDTERGNKFLRKNQFGLSPLIYSIWGEIDKPMKARNNNKEGLLIKSQLNAKEPNPKISSTDIIFKYLKKFIEDTARDRDRGLHESEWGLHLDKTLAERKLFECELGHIFKHYNNLMLDLTNVLYNDNTISLSYLIESADEGLINALSIKNDKDSPLLFSIQKTYTGCTDLLLKYIIELLSNSNRAISIKSKVEQELEKIIISSSSLIPASIETMLLSVKKLHFRRDIDVLPMIVFTNIEDLEAVRETEFRDNEKSDKILYTQLLQSSIRLPSESGSTPSLNLISSLHYCQNPMVFRAPLIKYYLKKRFDSLWIYIFFQALLTWVNIPLLIAILSESSIEKLCVILFICGNCMLLVIDLIQIFSLGIFKYLGDVNKLASYYLLKLCLIFFMYLFYENITALLFSSFAGIFAIYLQIDRENRHQATSVEFLAVLVGILIGSGWGWWICLIVSAIIGVFIYGNGVIECSEKALRMLMISHAGLALVWFFVWIEWESLYFMIPLGIVIALVFVGISALSEDPSTRLFSSTVRMTIAMLLCVFNYSNPSIAIILLSMNLATLIGTGIAFLFLKKFGLTIEKEYHMRVALDIGNFVISLCFVLAMDAMMDILKLGLFIIPLATFLYDYKIAESRLEGDEKRILSSLKLFPITILFLANFQSYSELLLMTLAMTIVNLCQEIIVTEQFANNLIQNVYKITLNWNTIEITRLSFCIVWVHYYFKDEGVPTLIIYLLALFTLFRGISGFRCFSRARCYVHLVLNSANIKDFPVLLFYATFAFGILSNLSQDQDIKFQSIWIRSYYLNLCSFCHIQEIYASYLMFFFAMIINVIAMLYLLISILGDSLEKLQISAADIGYMEMVEIIREVETVMTWKRNRTDREHLVVMDLLRDQNSANESEWEGNNSKISKDISCEINPLTTELQKMKKVINSGSEMPQNEDNVRQGIIDEDEPLKSENKELKESIQKLLDSEIFDQGSEISET